MLELPIVRSDSGVNSNEEEGRVSIDRYSSL